MAGAVIAVILFAAMVPGIWAEDYTGPLLLGDGNATNLSEGNLSDGNLSAEWAVDIAASPFEGYPPLCVKFEVTGPNGDYAWDFGDGTTSNARNPVHCYQKQGSYWVKLKYVYGKISGEVTKENFIKVFDPAVFVDFKAEPSSGKAPLAARFSIIGNPTNIIWDFGDGSDKSTEESPLHQYTDPGNYTPKLTYCIDGSCNKMDKFQYIEVLPGDPVDFVAERQSGMAPICTKFVVSGEADTFSWDFGDGTVSYEKKPVHCYNEPGKYTISLTYSIHGALYTITKDEYIIVSPRDAPDFNASPRGGMAPLCVDFTLINPPKKWEWEFGDNSSGYGDHTTHCYAAAGTYDLSLQYCSNNLCSQVDKPGYIEVTAPSILAKPGETPGDYTFTTTAPEGLKYLWDFGDGLTGEGPDPKHRYGAGGTYRVVVSITGTCGCVAKASLMVKVGIKTDLDITATPLEGCAPHCVQFNEISPEIPKSRTWDFGDGTTSEEKNPFHCYEAAGKYTVTLTDRYPDGEEQVRKENLITVNGVPRPSFTVYPPGGTAPLSAKCTDTTFDYALKRYWDFGDGSFGTDKIMDHRFEAPGDYNVTLTVWGAGNCWQKTSQVVRVEPPETATYDLSGLPRRGYAPLHTSFQITGKPFQWKVDFGDGQSSAEMNPFHAYETAGVYSPSLHACDADGCEDVNKPDYVVAIPPYYQNLSLRTGWNLISVPLTLTPGQDTASIFSGVRTAGHSIYSWDNEAASWERLMQDDRIVTTEGVWIYADDPVDVPLIYATEVLGGNNTVILSRGWNLFSIPGISPVPAPQVLSSLSSWRYLVGYDPVRQQYTGPYEPGTSGDLMLDPRQAFWLYMQDPAVMSVSGL